MGEFDSLLSPGSIGGLTTRNRVFMPAMVTGLANYRGEVTAELLAYYEARAASGPGVIVAEISCVDAGRGKAVLNQICIDHPRYLAGLSRLADRLKSGGSLAFVQLHHAGRQTSYLATEGEVPLSPSAVACRVARIMPREMTRQDIEELRERYVGAACLAFEAGFDGVEVHAAHGYLLSQFLSPYTNQRRDGYGGDTAGRTRIVAEIIRDIKDRYPDLVVGVRFNVVDFVPGGIELEEGVNIALLLEKAGADYLSVSCGMHESGLTTVEPKSFPEGWRIHLAKAVKERVALPVVGGGVIRHPAFANDIIDRGYVDFVFVGRGHIADEKWVTKVQEGTPEKIRPCLSCNVCINCSFKHLPITCTVNPRVGRENWLVPTGPTKKPLTVLVVGGGPAGMAAATGLARRGHRVTLVEAGQNLGGKLNVASRPPHKERLAELKEYLEKELYLTPAEVRLGCRCDQELVARIQPQVAVVATGAKPVMLPGLEGNHMAVQAVDILREDPPVSGRRVVVAGGGIVGCETALYLARHGNRVTLVEMGDRLAARLDRMSRRDLIDSLYKAGVVILTGHSVVSAGDGVACLKDSAGSLTTMDTDLVVLALGAKSYDPLSRILARLVPRVHIIGDAARPRNILSAIYEAELVVRHIE